MQAMIKWDLATCMQFFGSVFLFLQLSFLWKRREKRFRTRSSMGPFFAINERFLAFWEMVVNDSMFQLFFMYTCIRVFHGSLWRPRPGLDVSPLLQGEHEPAVADHGALGQTLQKTL